MPTVGEVIHAKSIAKAIGFTMIDGKPKRPNVHYHEAAHALVCQLYGVDVDQVCARRINGNLGHVTHPPDCRIDRIVSARILVAGAAVETILEDAPEFRVGCTHDLLQAWDVLGHLEPGERVGVLAEIFGETQQELLGSWDLLERIAGEIEGRCVSGDQIAAMVDAYAEETEDDDDDD